MSTDHTALALTLGAGAGLGLWALLRDEPAARLAGASTPAASTALPAPAASSTTPPSPPCALRLDAQGLTADGAPIGIPAAVARCQAAGRADLVIADDAPSAASAELSVALGAAGILIHSRRNGRRPGTGRRGAARVRYRREGRTILRDGDAVLRLERVDLGDQRFAITPHEADVLSQHIVELLNRSPSRRQAATAARAGATTHRIFLFRTLPTNGSSRTRFYEANPPTTWDDARRRLVAAGLLDERSLLPTEWSLVTDPPLHVQPDRLRPLPDPGGPMANRNDKDSTGRAVAIVGGGALVLWLLLRGKGVGLGDAAAATTDRTPTPPPCRVRIDGDGITVDGERADLATTIARCGAAGSADLRATGDAITGVIAEVVQTLERAGVRVWATPEVWNAAQVAPAGRPQ